MTSVITWHERYMRDAQRLRDIASRMISLIESVAERNASPQPLAALHYEAEECVSSLRGIGDGPA